MNSATHHWWAFLCAVGALNVAAWAISARRLQQRVGPTTRDDERRFRRLQLLLSAGYVFGCAYRSALPVFDVPRLCLVDSWMSSVIVGRSVATFAELCFAAQWALVMRAAGDSAGSPVTRAASRSILPLILLAELCSWYSVLTTSNLGHVVEETIWGLCAALFFACAVVVAPRCERSIRPLLALLLVGALAYACYMFAVDVPMYWGRWVMDQASGREYLSIQAGVLDASTRWIVSQRWDDWKSEVIWMSLYFSVAVWLSIGLMHAPMPRQRAGPRTG